MSVSGITSSNQIQTDYMKLLVTQLQNQNPLEPMDNNDMAAQLTQFSQLEQLESMNSNFSSVLENAKREYAVSLIGKQVSFMTENQAGEKEMTQGLVEQVYNDPNGKVMLQIGDYAVDIQGVVSVR